MPETPQPVTPYDLGRQFNETAPITELLRTHCLKGGIGIFQSVLTSSENINGSFRQIGDNFFDGHAKYEDYSSDWQWVSTWLLSSKVEEVSSRFKLLNLDKAAPKTLTDSSYVGVGVLYTFQDPEQHPIVIIGGALSPDHVGTYEGGRTNNDNFLLLKFDNDASATELIRQFDLEARGRTSGTSRNGDILSQVYHTFSSNEQIVGRMERRMYRNLEIIDVKDKRNNPKKSVKW